MRIASSPPLPDFFSPGPSSETSADTKRRSLWTPGCWSDSESSGEEEQQTNTAIKSFNEAMKTCTLSEQTRINKMTDPLTFQLTGAWDNISTEEKGICIEKALEACKVVCEVIAPNSSNDLFDAVKSAESRPEISEELVTLMLAYQNAKTRNLKLQILSLYAHRYPVKQLQEIHEPYGRITTWQIKMARKHARENSPGSLVEKTKQHRIRLDMLKVDHFIEFANRPYFYHDVAYGTRDIKLDSGSKLTMPNVIRNVSRATMVAQYLKFCEEDKVEPLSRRTLFRILEVREASERKSLQGVDNIAADGSLGFERIKHIVLELESLGVDKEWVENTLKRLHNARLYLTTDYTVHCNEEGPCPDHCRNFALSDPTDESFQEKCSHEHSLFCDRCEDLKATLNDVLEKIQTHSSNMYSDDHKGDFLYDLNKSKGDIFHWKCHIMRSCNQERAKQSVLQELDETSALVIMDWAMKFLQLRHREKQADWHGKRGISWHVSSVITRESLESTSVSVSTFAHLIDSCSQDWFAVCSVFEDLLQSIRTTHPDLKKVFLRSDEAGCYHNNMLMASLKDVGKRVGIDVARYDFSEPQFGKDICDRILCPLKHAIRKYCDEGHDILRAEDMREALLNRPVSGTTASVNSIDEKAMSIQVRNIDRFSSLHNFQFENNGVRTWKAYGIGEGRFVSYKDTVLQPQQATGLKTLQEFFPFLTRTLKSEKESEKEAQVFECTVPGCGMVFSLYENLNIHLQTGKHDNIVEKETLYDKIRRGWAERFSTIDVRPKTKQEKIKRQQQSSQTEASLTSSADPSALENRMGWALKPPTASARFSQQVRDYLTAKFDAGERSGRKANPSDVEMEMRNSRDQNDKRRFTRDEWLSSAQIKSFFSRLAATRRKAATLQTPLEDLEAESEEHSRREALREIARDLQVQHPIIYDIYDLCDMDKQNRLNVFNVSMLKNICEQFEIPFKSRERKADLISKVHQMVADCSCSQQEQIV